MNDLHKNAIENAKLIAFALSCAGTLLQQSCVVMLTLEMT